MRAAESTQVAPSSVVPVTSMTATSASVRSAELARAIAEKLQTPEGGVLSYVRDGQQEDPDENGVGHERLSESTGLVLAHAVAAKDTELFRLAADFYRRHLRADVQLAYWKLDAQNQPVRSRDGAFSSAPNDELRILRALRAGGALTGDSGYDADVRSAAGALLVAVRDGLLRDNVSWGSAPPSASDRVEVDYLDVAAMRMLATDEPRWAEAAERGLATMSGAVRRDGPPWQFYDPADGRYSCPGPCPTIAGLYTGLHLEEAGDRTAASEVYRFYSDQLNRGSLAGTYSAQGVRGDPEDLAGYALMARLAFRLGEHDRAQAILQRWVEPHRQASGPVGGLYSYSPDDASAFDNLELLLTFHELEGKRPPAD